MPTYTDLEHLVNEYLREVGVYVVTHVGFSKRPPLAMEREALEADSWATIRADEATRVQILLGRYQKWLVSLRAYGVYDGPITLTHYGGGDGDGGSD